MDLGTPETAPLRRRASFLDGWVRFLAAVFALDAFLGGAILGVLIRLPGGHTLPWWDGLVLAAALWRRNHVILTVHAALALWNCVEVIVRGGMPISIVAAGLLLWAAWRPEFAISRAWRWAGAGAAGPVLLLAHILTFGAMDYRRPADAIVVFGAKPGSLALHDRVREGVRLYHAGYAPRMVLSGTSDEVDDMERLARLEGVPGSAIVRDPDGFNTFATLRNLRDRRVLAVSHGYHLARIKSTAARLGLDCRTVPCRESRTLTRMPYFVARECAAFVAYYLLRR